MNRFLTKKFPFFLLIPVLLSFNGVAYKANFAGNWTLNESKSELGEFGGRFSAKKIKVEQKDDAVTIAKTFPGFDGGEDRTTTEILSFDGKTLESTGFFNSKKKSTIKWSDDGNSFTITYSIVFERDGQTTEINGTETWTLSDEGKTLTLQVASTSAQGEFKVKAAYDKS